MLSNNLLTPIPQQGFSEFNCKIVASIESSSENYSSESKVEQYFNFGHAQPFQEQQTQVKYISKNLDKLEKELNYIDQMKHNYESRNDRTRNFNTQNSEKERQRQRQRDKSRQKSRSIEKKHILQPSKTPLFVRKFDANKREDEAKTSQQQSRSFHHEVSLQTQKSQQTTHIQTKQKQFIQLTKQFHKLQQQLNNKNNIIQSLSETVNHLKRERDYRDDSAQCLKEQNRVLKLDHQKIKIEKEQLQTILKDLLFERERQKLFRQDKEQNQNTGGKQTPISNNSNVTSSRKSITPGRCTLTRPSPRDQNINSNYYGQKVSNGPSGNKASYRERVRDNRQGLEEISMNEEHRRGNDNQTKKMKVQNILDKLKIKINKI